MTRKLRMARVTRTTGLADARPDARLDAGHAGAGAQRASVTGGRNGSAPPSRPRRRALTRGDRAALGIGIALALLMLAWLGWKLAATVARDRAVAPGLAPAPAMPGH